MAGYRVSPEEGKWDVKGEGADVAAVDRRLVVRLTQEVPVRSRGIGGSGHGYISDFSQQEEALKSTN